MPGAVCPAYGAAMDLNFVRSGAGRPFIWGHGLTSSMASEAESGLFRWDTIPGIDITRYDAPGHGQSPGVADPDRYAWPRLAQDMLEVADEVNAESFIAGGASMGCATALATALAAPSRVHALVLVIPPTAWETRAAQTSLYMDRADFVEREGVAALVEANRALPPQPPFMAYRREISLRHLAAMDPAVLPSIMRGAASSNLAPRDEIATITVPTLILAWADDPGHPVSTAESLHELIGSSQLEVATSREEVEAWPSRLAVFVEELATTA